MIPVSGEKVEARLPVLTILLMAACIWAFVVVQPSGADRDALSPTADARSFTTDHAAIPCEVLRGQSLTQGEFNAVFVEGTTNQCAASSTGQPANPDKNVYLALIYSMFLHVGWIHLIGNMFSLWVFGSAVELTLGRVRYLALYVVGGVIATLGHIVYEAGSAIPIVGASGAIAAVMGAYLVLFPLSVIRVWLLVVVPMPALLFLGGWFALQFTFGPDSSVAWMAHVTGFVAGIVGGLVMRLSRKRPNREFAPERVT